MEEELLKTMKITDVFVENAVIVRGKRGSKQDDVITKFHIGKLMPKKELADFIKELKKAHKIVNDEKRFERLNLVTIER